MNQWQQFEVDEFEKQILIKLFGQVTIPDKTAKVLSALRIDLNKLIKDFENKIVLVLNDDGRVNSSRLKGVISVYRPQLVRTLDIPDTDFRLVDIIDELCSLIGGLK